MKIKNYKYIIGALALGLFSSCDYESINTNQLEMTPEMGIMDGIAVGAPFKSIQQNVFPVGTQADDTDVINQYQIAYHLSADSWAGYFGQNNNWDGGRNHLTYVLNDGWISASYKAAYSSILDSWKKIKDEHEKIDMPETFALAQILKISAWHKATDMFGPIPYKHAGEPILVVPYDSQEDVYQYFFDDLSEAINILTPLAEQNGKLMANYDAIYAGSASKWVQYANSLKLRLAMRIRYADAEKAKRYAEEAVNHPIGVMMAKDDEAQISKGAGSVFVNNIEWLDKQYNESRMGSSILAYLSGYEDPRLPKYFEESDSQYAVEVPQGGKYHAISTGLVKATNDYFKAFSHSNFKSETPTYWMRASEVYFLRAEGALIGWNMKGDAESLYKEGISISFEENGIPSSAVDAYINSGKAPAKYELEAPISVNVPAPTSATAEWEGSTEQKLEKIITQKWIALFPNGQEAWSEWRRTGYPKLHQVIKNNSGGEVSTEKGIRRMIYPKSERQSADQIENYNKAVELLGGPDKPSTNLWWDKK